MWPWKSYNATSIILYWLKQSQAYPDSRREIHSTSYWRECENIWDHFLKLPHLLTNVFCYPASSSWFMFHRFSSLWLYSALFQCRYTWGAEFARGGHMISVCLQDILSKQFGEYFISILHWVTIFRFVEYQTHNHTSLCVHLFPNSKWARRDGANMLHCSWAPF